MIPNALAVANGKGGVFKTSIATNVAGLAAASGWKVLVVDTDGQGNVALDLGVIDRSDFGAGLYAAMIDGAPLRVVSDVRERLDYVPGGEAASGIAAGLSNKMAQGEYPTAIMSLDSALAPIAPNYHLIIIDTPPGDRVLQQAVMAASRFVLIPTQPDRGSRAGIDRVARDIVNIERFNDQVEILGVVGVDVSRGATAIKERARERLVAEVGAIAPIFDSFIHTLDMAGEEMRETGTLAHEYEVQAHAEETRWSVADRIRARKEGKTLKSYSTGASKLAGDYEALTNEILEAIERRNSITGQVISS